MKSVWNCSLAILLVVVASTAYGQTTFTLGFAGPSEFTDAANTPWTGDYNATLDSGGTGTGAQGWSLSMSADNAEISAVTTTGTDVDALFSGGFRKSELTTKGKDACAGKKGAVSAVVLSFTLPVTLPVPPSTSIVAKISAGGTIGAADGTATLRYIDNCQGAGQPVQNNITQDGATVAPVLGTKDIALKVVQVVRCCAAQGNVGFSDSPKNSATAYDGIKDDGDPLSCSGGGGTIETLVAKGSPASRHVYTNISSNGAGDGVQGWSLSMAVNGDISIDGLTTAGTAIDALFAGGFKKTEAIDPAKNGGQRGAVSAIVLSFTLPVTLPPTGTATVLDFTFGGGVQGDATVAGEVKFQSGLRGAGQPVQNALTIGGATVDACNFGSANVKVLFSPLLVTDNFFVRGNANNDAKLDIADAIWIVNELFRSGPATACREAANANGDAESLVDAADVAYLIAYEFQGGPAPPPPASGARCDQASTDKCAETQVGCP